MNSEPVTINEKHLGKLEAKVALITGGNSGIGLATAKRFVNEGAYVFITGRRKEELNAAVKEIGKNVTAVQGDVSNLADLDRLFVQIKKEKSKLDIVFANAGVAKYSPLGKITEEFYDSIFDINVWGVLNSMRHEIPAMLKNGGGAIVNTSSVAGHVGMGQVSIYIASKHAVEGLTKALALEFAKQNIRINAVAPAGVATEMVDRFAGKEGDMRDYLTSLHPVGRIGTSEEIAAAVLYLCSDDARFTTGTSLVVDGGMLAQ